MNQQPGFVMLLTLTVLALVTTMILNVWFITSFQLDIVQEREKWYQHQYTTQAVLDGVVNQVINQYQEIENRLSKRGAPSIAFDMSSIIEQPYNRIVGYVECLPRRRSLVDGVLVRAVIYNKIGSLCAMRCLLKKSIITVNNRTRIVYEVFGFTLD